MNIHRHIKPTQSSKECWALFMIASMCCVQDRSLHVEELEVVDSLQYQPYDEGLWIFCLPLLTSTYLVIKEEVLLPTRTDCALLIRKSRIQMQREKQRPSSLSLVMSLKGMILLNTEV